jgi:hypothetical protein
MSDIKERFGRKRDEIVWGWRKLHTEELNNLYSSPNVIIMIEVREGEMDSACSTHAGEEEYIYRVFVGNPEGKRPVGRPRRRWEDNIKLDVREIGRDGMDCIDVNRIQKFVTMAHSLEATFRTLDSVSVLRQKPTQLGPINRANLYLRCMD